MNQQEFDTYRHTQATALGQTTAMSAVNIPGLGTHYCAERINERIEKEYYRDQNSGEARPYVCFCCDKLLQYSETVVASSSILADMSSYLHPQTENVDKEISDCYKINKSQWWSERGDIVANLVPGIEDLLLSPRSVYVEKDHRNQNNLWQQNGLLSCRSCLLGLHKKQLPKYAIANGYFMGTPPSCLTELNDVELALLTPVKTFGYVFSYTGGKNMKLKGSLSYYRVNVHSIAKAVMNLDVLGLHKNIVTVFYGKLTKEQYKRAKEKSKVSVSKVITAIEWLVQHNEVWRKSNVDLDAIREHLREPVIIDNSTLVDEGNNIEKEESFKVFFPDGALTETNGGHESLQDFQRIAKDIAANGGRFEINCDFAKTYTYIHDGDTLVNSSLLQFPFGRGGIHEKRIKGTGSLTTTVDIEDYCKHIARLSQTHFHHELFSLILYNTSIKQKILRSTFFNVRDKKTAHALATDLTPSALCNAIGNRRRAPERNEQHYAFNHADKFLQTIDAVAKAIPHTNDASKKALSQAYAHQHNFGLPHIFLTITPDDENSFLIEVYIGRADEQAKSVEETSDEELQWQAKKRTAFRLEFPGLCAFFYQTVVDIVIEEIIGWDLKSNRARTEGGLFGIPQAFTLSTEEQGRRTLHMHIQVWIEALEELRRTAFHGTPKSPTTHEAKRKLCHYLDEIAATALDSNFPKRKDSFLPCFSCGKESCKKRRLLPEIVSDQQLRNLRHELGQNEMRGTFAFCKTCNKCWTNTEFTGCRLMKGPSTVKGLTSFPDSDVRRLKAMCVEYQSGTRPLNTTVVNAAYNFHQHTQSCFAKKKRKRSDANTTNDNQKSFCECRYRSPKRAKRITQINPVEDKKIDWFKWNGTSTSVHIQEVLLKRHAFDAFQNEYCRAISNSRLCCNSNVSLLMYGPTGQYSFKYAVKATQDEDADEYDGVQKGFQRANERLKQSPHKSDISKACSLVLSASYSHQQGNIVGAAMASYLTQTGSRYIFSHKSVWCPLQDIIALLEKKTINTNIRFSGTKCFYSSFAMDYLCRPERLEQCNVRDFFALYEVVNVTGGNRKSLLPFSDTRHPSHQDNRQHISSPHLNGFLQGVRKRKIQQIPRVNQWIFADSASFNGNILLETTQLTDEIVQHAKYVLCLMYPFRKLKHLQKNGCYVQKLRKVIADGEITDQQLEFLQNIQDSKSNSFRVTKIDDDLHRNSSPFQPSAGYIDPNGIDDDEEEQILGPEGEELDDLLDSFLREAQDELDLENDQTTTTNLPKTFSVDEVQMKGDNKCGYSNLAPVNTGEHSDDIIHSRSHIQTNSNTEADSGDGEGDYCPTRQDLVSILLSKTSVRRRKFQTSLRDKKEVPIPEANGSCRSIHEWTKLAGLDDQQASAFQVFCATFILSFYHTAGNCVLSPELESRLSSQKNKLNKLAYRKSRGARQLICLLHGPGGSGKTAVIDLTLEYCREFCGFIEGFKFTPQTIVVSALSGVAATNLLGDTIHRSAYLCQKCRITPEQVQRWCGVTRLVIVDEISFASRALILKLHTNLSILMQNRESPYGGANIVFLGDFRQLHPVGVLPLYEEKNKEFFEWINIYIELHGMYRFKDDPDYGRLLSRMRNGVTTKEDILKLNRRVVVNGKTLDGDTLPCALKYGTSRNKERDAINAGLFLKRCQQRWAEMGNLDDTVLVFMSRLKVKTGKKVYSDFKASTSFWKKCSEDDLKLPNGRGRVDPVLRLHIGCSVMLTQNICVANAMANGTTAIVTGIRLKDSATTNVVKIDGNIPVRAVAASDVEEIVLEHTNERVEPRNFSMNTKEFFFTAHILKPASHQCRGSPKKDYLRMKGVQLPVVVNHATTGHKLQGFGVDNILINNWSYQANWPYLMLSRVKSYKGLFMTTKISNNLNHYRLSPAYLRMLQHLRNKRPHN